MAADPLGATNLDTGEFFLGSVTVTPVFFESDGSSDDHTENWTQQEIDDTLAKINESVEWWSTLLGTITDKHTLDFVIDDTYAQNPVETRFEPISNTSQTFGRYVGDFLVDEGFGDSTSVNHAMLRFNDQQRNAPGNQTDWAFTIFVLDSSEDEDGLFDLDGDFAGAFAFSGGLYVVTPSSRPAATFAHEIGHIFWARDEYPGGGSYTDRAGYYNTQNINAFDNPNLEQEPGIMRGGVRTTEAYEQGITSSRSLEFLGWRDSDGDGVFDLADVPLELDIVGTFDAESSVYHVTGSATAVALQNQNSRSFQSDITLNEIDRLEYRLDGGDWTTAESYGEQQVEIDTAITITEAFETIEWRVVDTLITEAEGEVIITESPIVVGTLVQPALTNTAIRGFAFIDEDNDGQRSTNEVLLSGTTATLLSADGSALFGGSFTALDYDGAVPSTLAGVTLTAQGGQFNQQIYASESLDNADRQVFLARNFTFDRFEDAWGESVAFNAAFDETVGKVDVTVAGLDRGSYARLEAYDESGNLLSRTTSELIDADAEKIVSITDPSGRIASVRVFGHVRTEIAILDLTFGFDDRVTTDSNGSWQFANLAPGDYQVQINAENLIHQFDAAAIDLQATNQPGNVMALPASIVDSPRHNAALAFDVDGVDGVTPADILAVINDIVDGGTRLIGADEISGLATDVSNDGQISPLDVLMVINHLSSNDGASAQGELIPDTASSLQGQNSQRLGATSFGSSIESASANAARDSLFTQMFNSAGQSTGDESNSHRHTDSQRGTVVSSESNDSFEIGTKPNHAEKPGTNEGLRTNLSADLSALDPSNDAFQPNSLEPED